MNKTTGVVFASGLIVMTVPLFLIGCGGGSSGSDKPAPATEPAVLSQGTVSDSIAWADSTVPGCTVSGPGAMAAQSANVAKELAVGSVVHGLYSGMSDLRLGQGAPRTLYPQSDVFAGECGGTLSLSSDHAQGNTDYIIRFNNFCMMDYSATPPGQTIIDGTLEGTEHGEPGPFGPVVSKATAKVDRLSVQAGGETTNISLSGLTVEFGNPGTWGPDEPTAENPDHITLERLTFDLASQGRVHTVSGLDARSWERENWDSVLDISTGRYSSSAGWHVDMATSEPLVVNWDGELIAGSLELTGGDGDYVTVKPSQTNSGLLDMTLNDQPIEQSLDCREAGEGLLGFLIF